MRSVRAVWMAAMILVGSLGCSDQTDGAAGEVANPQDGPTVVEPSLTNRSWRLVAMTGRPTLPPDLEVTATFEGETVSGSSGCNRYSATWSVSGAVLEVSPITGTRMACPEPAASLETEFLTALGDAEVFVISGGELAIRSRGGILLAFEQADPADL